MVPILVLGVITVGINLNIQETVSTSHTYNCICMIQVHLVLNLHVIRMSSAVNRFHEHTERLFGKRN